MFFEKLELILKEKKITINKLSKEIEYSQSAMCKWKEGRKPQIDVLQRLCKYLNVSADYLLDLDNTPPPPYISDRETVLLENFRLCTKETQENIETLASIGAGKTEKEKAKTETSSELKNIG